RLPSSCDATSRRARAPQHTDADARAARGVIDVWSGVRDGRTGAQLGIDPVALRLRNYADTDPASGKPFSSKALRACYVHGAARFGWARRTPAPSSMRDGRDLVGWGMASAIMSTFRFPATARVTLEKGGTVLIAAGTQEIGTGVYTIMPQIAADVLGLPVERI